MDWTKLGSETWSAEGWAAGDQAVRGAMVADFLATHETQGAEKATITTLLGDPTGYYDYDSNLAYVVGPTGEVESVYADGYLLVFETKDGKVTEVRAVPELD